jgi:AcrR family transcriptional regulator
MYICLSSAFRFKKNVKCSVRDVPFELNCPKMQLSERRLTVRSGSWGVGERMRDGEHGAAGSVQAMRSERTRAALLSAAERVFARDGFEASRIEDIAAEAGRSRGAFYANFANKTEVFLALRSLVVQRRAREIRERLEPLSMDEPGGEEVRYQKVMAYMLEQICDTRTILLQIEFKLFALRHPAMLEELSEKHLEAAISTNQREIPDLLAAHGETEDKMRTKTMTMEAVLEGFALNALFCPQVLTEEQIAALVPKMLATVLSGSRGERVRV